LGDFLGETYFLHSAKAKRASHSKQTMVSSFLDHHAGVATIFNALCGIFFCVFFLKDLLARTAASQPVRVSG